MRPVVARFVLPPTVALLLAACGPNLPTGWDTAERVPVVQRECEGSPYDPERPAARVELVTNATGKIVGFRAVQFRCAQEVEGFAKQANGRLDVLLQPVDLHPSMVAGCDCLYDVDATVELAGVTRVGGWTRQDFYASDTSEPTLVGEVAVE